jgi:hypothetical protein
MTRGLRALIPIVFLATVAVAHAQGPDRRLAVFVTAATTASQEDLAGSVEDVKLAVEGAGIRGRRKHLVLVNSAADAHLIVEIRSRRSAFGMPALFGRNYTVLYAVKPGSKITAARFAATRGDGSAGRAGAAAQDAPELLLEASGKGSWKLAGAIAATQVDTLAKKHTERLLTSAAEVP